MNTGYERVKSTPFSFRGPDKGPGIGTSGAVDQFVDFPTGVVASAQDIVDAVVVHIQLEAVANRTLYLIVHLDDAVVEGFAESHIDLTAARNFTTSVVYPPISMM